MTAADDLRRHLRALGTMSDDEIEARLRAVAIARESSEPGSSTYAAALARAMRAVTSN